MGSGCRKMCILCQQTSPKRWYGNMTMTSNCDVTSSACQIKMTTICHWMKPPTKIFCLRHCFCELWSAATFQNARSRDSCLCSLVRCNILNKWTDQYIEKQLARFMTWQQAVISIHTCLWNFMRSKVDFNVFILHHSNFGQMSSYPRAILKTYWPSGGFHFNKSHVSRIPKDVVYFWDYFQFCAIF